MAKLKSSTQLQPCLQITGLFGGTVHQTYLSALPIPQPISGSSTRPLSHFYDGALKKRGFSLTENQHSEVTEQSVRATTTRCDQINSSTLSPFLYVPCGIYVFVEVKTLYNKREK